MAGFPLACQVICHGPSFTGLRHFLFVIPSLAILAGIGLDAAVAAVCGERISFEKRAKPRLLQWIRMQQWEQADFFIAPTHMNCDRILDGKVIVAIQRLGVPIGYVKDRRALTRPAVAGTP
jgi:hypothetical protein